MCKRIITVVIIISVLMCCSSAECYAQSPVPSAKAYILMDSSTGRVLAEKNSDQRLPMASTTKILTALITLMQPDIDSYFVVDKNAIKVEGSSMGLQDGDKVNLYTLAVGMLLSSGNDAANAAAVRISGSVENFSKLMNSYAKMFKMTNSSFVTPSGLNDENHYSTAHDMAVLAGYAIKNDCFLSICSQSEISVFYGNPPYKRTLSNHNRLLKECEGCIGVKTGFTKIAGRCLVSAVKRKDVTLICVTLSAPNDWEDHRVLYDYGFSQVKSSNISLKIDGISANIVGGTKEKISTGIFGLASTTLAPNEQSTIKTKIILRKFYYAPVKKGDVLGEVQYLYNGTQIASCKLVAQEDVPNLKKAEEKSFFQKIIDFFKNL